MKKIFAILALSATTSAFAAGPTIAVSHDRDFGSETKLSIAQETTFGTFDAGLLATRYQKFGTVGIDDANGYEVGYAKGIAIGAFGIAPRVSFGRLNNIDVNGGGFTGSTNYFTLGAEGQLPITTSLNAFVGYRHRNPVGANPVQNRIQAGVDYAFSKNIGARVGISHARQAGDRGTGLTANVNYTF